MSKIVEHLVFEDLPLRTRKAARVRHALIRACMGQLMTSDFQSVRVADLCRSIEITEQTFFNYFPSKNLLITHLILLWGIETEYHLRQAQAKLTALETIEEAFAFTASKMAETPRVAAALLARQASRLGPPNFPDIALADRLLWFPDSSGIESIPTIGILGILRPRVDLAIRNGELSGHSNTEVILQSLFSIFVGVPTFHLWDKPSAIAESYRQQLAICWRGLGS